MERRRQKSVEIKRESCRKKKAKSVEIKEEYCKYIVLWMVVCLFGFFFFFFNKWISRIMLPIKKQMLIEQNYKKLISNFAFKN